MDNKYSEEDDKELNAELKKLKNRAKKLILDDYYDSINLSELQYSMLKQVTNAETHYDISPYLWNTGSLQKNLDYIEEKIKKARKEDRKRK